VVEVWGRVPSLIKGFFPVVRSWFFYGVLFPFLFCAFTIAPLLARFWFAGGAGLR